MHPPCRVKFGLFFLLTSRERGGGINLGDKNNIKKGPRSCCMTAREALPDIIFLIERLLGIETWVIQTFFISSHRKFYGRGLEMKIEKLFQGHTGEEGWDLSILSFRYLKDWNWFWLSNSAIELWRNWDFWECWSSYDCFIYFHKNWRHSIWQFRLWFNKEPCTAIELSSTLVYYWFLKFLDRY